MSSASGRALRVQLFGESHGPAVGVTLDGLPAGLRLDVAEVQAFLDRRSPAHARGLATARREADAPRILSGLADGFTTGGPLCAIFENADAKPADYAFLPRLPRPGHADWPMWAHSGGYEAFAGGGRASGRLTLSYAFAGAAALALLAARGVRVYGRLAQAGGATDIAIDPLRVDEPAWAALRSEAIPALDASARERMRAEIEAARDAGDSVGGLAECVALGLPAGLGEPYFDNLESAISAQLFAIPGVKAVAFGDGWAVAGMRGSAYNDAYAGAADAGDGVVESREGSACANGVSPCDGTLPPMEGHESRANAEGASSHAKMGQTSQGRESRLAPLTNHAGGLLGGMTTGAPLVVRCSFRPTASIALPQQTADLFTGAPETLAVPGRHDPCIALRAVPVVEAAAALALADAWLTRYGNAPLGQKARG